jgi:hypothetical protein
VLARNLQAFARRYPSVPAAVFGPYEGSLDNAGERLELTDACGENILDFEYKDGWYPASDGTGRSLVLRDSATPHDAFGDATTWALSGGASGSPGAVDDAFAQAYYGWDNFHFTEAQREDLLVSGPFADPDGDGRLNWVEYALGRDPWAADAEGIGTAWVDASGRRAMALTFSRPSLALDVAYELLTTSDLVNELWGPVGWTQVQASAFPRAREAVTLRESDPTDSPSRFYRLRMTFQGE